MKLNNTKRCNVKALNKGDRKKKTFLNNNPHTDQKETVKLYL